jgi:hypothetical protein
MQIRDSITNPLSDAVPGPAILSQQPGVGGVALILQVVAKYGRRSVACHEAWKNDHGLPVSPWRPPQ